MVTRNSVVRSFRKHWKIMFGRPKNGAESMKEIDSSLRKIRRNRRLMCAVVAKMVEETKTGERIMKEDVPSPGHP